MKLTTDQQKKDYYFGYVTRLADDISHKKYKEVYEWACKSHSVEDYKEKVEELEWELTLLEAHNRM